MYFTFLLGVLMPSVLCGFVCTSQHHHFLGFQEPKAEAILKYQEATGPRVKNIHPQLNVIWLPSPFIPLKHSDFRSSGTCWLPNLWDVSVLILMSFLKDLDFDNSSLFHALSPWFPEQKSSPDICLFFFFSEKLLRAARCFFSLALPTFLVCRRQVKPTVFYFRARF